MSSPVTRKIGFGILAVLLILGLMEAGARLYEVLSPPGDRAYPTPEPGPNPALIERLAARRREVGAHIPMIADLQNRWALSPGVINAGKERWRINSLGLRGPEVGPPQPGEVRILTIGDSTIFGDMVPEPNVFSSVAAAELARRWGRPVRGVIGGVPGYDSSQSLRLLERVGRRVRPSYVVIGNIWSDIYTHDAALVPVNRGRLLTPLAGRSALYRLVRRALAPSLRPVKVRFITSRQDIGGTHGSPPTRIPLGQYARNLDAMARIARDLGAEPVFLRLPAPMDFDRVPPPDTVADFREAMAQVAASHGAPVLDGVAAFRRSHDDAVWFVDQVHPSLEGHHLLGTALAELLDERFGASHTRP